MKYQKASDIETLKKIEDALFMVVYRLDSGLRLNVDVGPKETRDYLQTTLADAKYASLRLGQYIKKVNGPEIDPYEGE